MIWGKTPTIFGNIHLSPLWRFQICGTRGSAKPASKEVQEVDQEADSLRCGIVAGNFPCVFGVVLFHVGNPKFLRSHETSAFRMKVDVDSSLLWHSSILSCIQWICSLSDEVFPLRKLMKSSRPMRSREALDIIGQVETRHGYTDRHDISWYALIQFTVMKDLFLCQAFFGGNNPFGVFGFDDDDMGGMGGAWTQRCSVVLSKHVKQVTTYETKRRMYHKYIQISSNIK